MARFQVRDTFAINDKTFFVLAGFALEGEVAAHMLVRMPFNAQTMMTAEIDHIQQVQRPDGDVLCLCIRCTRPDEVTLWEALKIAGRTIDVIPPA